MGTVARIPHISVLTFNFFCSTQAQELRAMLPKFFGNEC